jgi:hypothetical protein
MRNYRQAATDGRPEAIQVCDGHERGMFGQPGRWEASTDRSKGTSASARCWAGEPSKADALNLILRPPLLGPVIELRRAWAFMCVHLLGVLQCPAMAGNDFVQQLRSIAEIGRLQAGNDRFDLDQATAGGPVDQADRADGVEAAGGSRGYPARSSSSSRSARSMSARSIAARSPASRRGNG